MLDFRGHMLLRLNRLADALIGLWYRFRALGAENDEKESIFISSTLERVQPNQKVG